MRHRGTLPTVQHLVRGLVQTLPAYPFHGTRVSLSQPVQTDVRLLTTHTLVPVYDARALCTDEVDIGELRSYNKGSLEQLENADIPSGSFVGIGHCVRWIPSGKHTGRERVQFSIAEVYLLADPEVDEWVGGSSRNSAE